MFDIPLLLIFIVCTALVFDFTNGAHDCANAVATIISTRVLHPTIAIGAAAFLNLCGALMGTAVAKTLGAGIVIPEVIGQSQVLVLAALTGAIVWNVFTWYKGIPSSSSHALVGGLIGSGYACAGVQALNGEGICTKVLLPLVGAPIGGFCAGFFLMWLLYWIFSRMSRKKVDRVFRTTEFFTAGFLALSHGLNDAQKTMGIVTLALLLFGYADSVEVPLWVKLSCAGAMSLGTALGGRKIIKTMGGSIFKLEPVHGVCSEVSASFVIGISSLLGAPVSTTHTITASIVGVGSSKRLRAVRWGVARNLVTAWIVTLPCAAFVGFLAYRFYEMVF